MRDLLQFVWFKDLTNWSVKTYLNLNIINSCFNLTSLENLISPRQEKVKKSDYRNDIDLVKKISFKDGSIHLRDEKKSGMDMYRLYPNDLLVSKINFHQGALAVNDFGIEILTSTHYQPYIVSDIIDKKYLVLVLRSNAFQQYLSSIKSEGIKTEATYNFIKTLKIPLPPLKIQQKIVDNYKAKLTLAKQQEQQAQQKEAEIETYLYEVLGIELPKAEQQNTNLLQFVWFKDMDSWSYEQLFLKSKFYSKHKVTELSDICEFKNKRFNRTNYAKDFFNYVDIGSIDPLNGIMSNKKTQTGKAPSRATQYINTGDLIIATTRPYLKKFAIVQNTFNDNVCSSGFTVIQKNTNKYNLYYIREFLQSFYGVAQLKEHMTGGLYPAITLTKLKNIQIPFPPLKIQNQIADHIQSLKEEITTLKQNAQDNKQSALSDFEAEIFNAS